MTSTSLRALAKSRSEFYHQIRCFFNHQNYVEVETPVLSETLIPESAIEVFETHWHCQGYAPHALYLTPSPEIYMKSLIAQGIGDCYQLTKAFRNAEHTGLKHLSEFMMLEWYSMNTSYHDNIQTTQAMLKHLAPLVCEENRHFFLEFEEITMQQLVLKHTGIDLQACQTLEEFKTQASVKGYGEYSEKSPDWETLFHFIFVSNVEPYINPKTTVFIKDFPWQIPTTARRSGSCYERWEFYMNGWEIANCYTEEASFEAMQALFQEEGELKQKMQVPHPVNMEYLDIFKTTDKNEGFPPCSGVALGVDRLFAIAQNASTLAQVQLCSA